MLPKIVVPTTTFKIPSSGQEITIRQMVSREEKILLMAKESASTSTQTDDIPRAIRQVCVNCNMSENVNIDKDLTTFDIQALFVKIREISVSNIVKVSYIDNEDQKQYDFDIDLKNITITNLGVANRSIKITDTLLMNMKYPTSDVFIDPEYIAAVDATDFMIRACIKTVVNAKGETYDFAISPKNEQIDFIDSLPIDARNEAIQFLNTLPTLYYKIEYTNSKGTPRSIELKTLADFFTL